MKNQSISNFEMGELKGGFNPIFYVEDEQTPIGPVPYFYTTQCTIVPPPYSIECQLPGPLSFPCK